MRMTSIVAGLGALALALVIGANAPDNSYTSFAAAPTPRPTPKPPGGPVPPAPVLEPAPPVVPAPTAEPAAAGSRRYTNAKQGWSVEFPADWRLSASYDAGGAIFTSFDPGTASFQRHDLRTGLGDVPPSEVRVNVDVWSNDGVADAATFVARDDENGRVRSRVKEVSRRTVTVAGQTGLELTREELSSDSVRRTITYYVFPSPTRDRMFVVSIVPGTNVHANAVAQFLGSLKAVR